MRFLRSNGYRFVFFGSGMSLTNRNEYADWDVGCGMVTEFQTLLLETTLLAPFAERFAPYAREAHRERVLCTFSKLAEVQHRVQGPRFVFAHILAPHPPFVFGPNGERITDVKFKMSGGIRGHEQPYLDQLTFVNRKVKELVERILSEARVPPIIILQADHGTASTGGWDQPSERLIRERTGILNAYYLPGDARALLYDSITPVNSFRLILSHYFGAGYDLLEDRVYFSNYERPYKLMEVTDLVFRK